MPSKAAYRDLTKKLVFPLTDDPKDDLVVFYFQNRITPNWSQKFTEISDLPDREAMPAFCAMFVEVTGSWNMTETDAKDSPTLPITVDEVMDFGLITLKDLLSKYIDDSQSPEVVAATREPSALPLVPVRKGSMA